MKSYTDIEQSKKLAEILPLESADMRYGYIAPYDFSDRMYDGGYDEIPYPKDFLIKNPNFSDNEYDSELPCWSLAALLDFMKDKIIFGCNSPEGWFCCYTIKNPIKTLTIYKDSLIDACYEMILKLNELKML